MNAKKIFPFFILIAMLICCTLAACGGKDAGDQAANILPSEDEHITMVKGGHPLSHPDKTYGDAFEAFFASPAWTYFEGSKEDSDENCDIVEFTGYCTYQGVEVKALLQFTLDGENGTFEATYLSFNEVPQSSLMLAALVEAAFTNEALDAPDDAAGYSETQPEQTAGVTDPEELYSQVLAKYKQAIQEDWGRGELEDAGLNYQCSLYLDALSEIGYACMDWNGDGIDELFIGDNYEVFDMYTVYQGKLVTLFQGGERDRYHPCTDNIVIHEGSNSATERGWASLRYQDGELVLVESVNSAYDESEAGGTFFYSTKPDGSGTYISWDQADQIMEKYEGTEINIPLTPLGGSSKPSGGTDSAAQTGPQEAYPYLLEFAALAYSDPSALASEDEEEYNSFIQAVKEDYDRWAAGTDYHFIVIDSTGHLAIDYEIAEAEGIVGLW